MDAAIKKVVKGNAPSMLDTEKANEVITALNSLLGLEINPQGFGKLVLAEKNAKLDLTPIRDLINQLQTTVSAFSQANGGGGAPGGGGGGGGGTSTLVRTTINAIISGLAGATLDAECDPVTRAITVTMTISLPPPI